MAAWPESTPPPRTDPLKSRPIRPRTRGSARFPLVLRSSLGEILSYQLSVAQRGGRDRKRELGPARVLSAGGGQARRGQHRRIAPGLARSGRHVHPARAELSRDLARGGVE